MKTLVATAILATMLVFAPGHCYALRLIGPLTKERAKELGIEVKITENGPEQVWVELEFKPEAIKDFNRVEMEIRDGEKFLLARVPLQERRTNSGKVIVSYISDRSYLEKTFLTFVEGQLPRNQSGLQMRVKDFVDQKK